MKLDPCARAVAAALLLSALAAPRALAQADAERPRAAGTEVAAPKRSKFVPPRYPAEAQARGLRGIVILELVIDTEGKVAAVTVVRSVPEFDEAAVTAARQWEYEITRVDGKPVPVRITVPITFAMKLPSVRGATGIPSLRQGVAPSFPAEAGGGATVEAALTVDADGRLTEAEITSGRPPFSDALLGALRTWRFAPVEGEHALTFKLRADFVPAGGSGAARVDVQLSDPRRAEATTPSATPPAGASPPPLPTPPSPAAATTAPPEAAPAPSPSAGASPAASEPPAAGAAPAAPPSDAGPRPRPAEPPAPKPAPTAAADAPPPVEVIPAAPPTMTAPASTVSAAPEEGVSAIRDVTLASGVPDLPKGRRPVVPPLARIQGVRGTVEVTFLVEGSGQTVVRNVSGPELLRDAARQTVSSWTFRRTRPERLPLKAVFSYTNDTASATVGPES